MAAVALTEVGQERRIFCPRAAQRLLAKSRGIDMPHFYGVLGIASNADKTQVKVAFRNLAKTCHPDVQGGQEARFKEISQAYSTLVNPSRRAAYDARCARARAHARRRFAGAMAIMAASFAATVGSGVAVAGWLLGA
ncbi:MAG TPA: J domain-containing protein [Hyphomicrobiaceae bacterium]|jgi:DnaJ-class molecular chaperone